MRILLTSASIDYNGCVVWTQLYAQGQVDNNFCIKNVVGNTSLKVVVTCKELRAFCRQIIRELRMTAIFSSTEMIDILGNRAKSRNF